GRCTACVLPAVRVCHHQPSSFTFFFFQAEDGIRDFHVTGVQTCALPIFAEEGAAVTDHHQADGDEHEAATLVVATAAGHHAVAQIGRASCRERGESARVGGAGKTENCTEGVGH